MSNAPVPAVHGTGRRWAAVCLPIIVVLFLFFLGRRATNAATVPAAPASASTATLASTPTGAVADASPSVDSPTDAAPPDAPRPAIEQLADGGVIVDLNLATESELRKLPGVGPTRARKIIELRTHLGRFKSVDDLARIKGFGRATLRRLRPITRAS